MSDKIIFKKKTFLNFLFFLKKKIYFILFYLEEHEKLRT